MENTMNYLTFNQLKKIIAGDQWNAQNNPDRFVPPDNKKSDSSTETTTSSTNEAWVPPC
jgi:hypothetical protein